MRSASCSAWAGKEYSEADFCKNIATLGHSEWPYYELCTLIYGHSALVQPSEHLHLGSCAMVPPGALLQFPDPDRVFANIEVFREIILKFSPFPNHWSNAFDTLSLRHCSFCTELVNSFKKGQIWKVETNADVPAVDWLPHTCPVHVRM